MLKHLEIIQHICVLFEHFGTYFLAMLDKTLSFSKLFNSKGVEFKKVVRLFKNWAFEKYICAKVKGGSSNK